MLTGKEEVLKIDNDEISSYLRRNLGGTGVTQIQVINNPFVKYDIQKLIKLNFDDGRYIACVIQHGRHEKLTLRELKEYLIHKRIRLYWENEHGNKQITTNTANI